MRGAVRTTRNLFLRTLELFVRTFFVRTLLWRRHHDHHRLTPSLGDILGGLAVEGAGSEAAHDVLGGLFQKFA